MDLTSEVKARIDSMTYESLLSKWRFAPVGDPLFQGAGGERRYARRPTAEHFAAILRATTAEEVLRLRGKDPEEEECCDGYSCTCGGRTYGENEREYRKELPPLEYCIIEEREVGPWHASAPE